MSETHTVQATSHVPKGTTKDDVLAEALGVINEHHPVIDFVAHRHRGDLVTVRLVFVSANRPEALRTAQAVLSALQHHWPTDSARLDKQSITSATKTDSMAPPDVIIVTVCTECGRVDLLGPRQGRHFKGGQACPGSPEEVRYTRDQSTTKEI